MFSWLATKGDDDGDGETIEVTFRCKEAALCEGEVLGVLIGDDEEPTRMEMQPDNSWVARVAVLRGDPAVYYRYVRIAADGVMVAPEPDVYRSIATTDERIHYLPAELLIRDSWGESAPGMSVLPSEAAVRVANGITGRSDPRVAELIALRADLARVEEEEQSRVDARVEKATEELEAQTTALAAELARVRSQLRAQTDSMTLEVQLEAQKAAFAAEKATLERRVRNAERSAATFRNSVMGAMAEAAAATARAWHADKERQRAAGEEDGEMERPEPHQARRSRRRSSVGTTTARFKTEIARLRRELEEVKMQAHDAVMERDVAAASMEELQEENKVLRRRERVAKDARREAERMLQEREEEMDEMEGEICGERGGERGEGGGGESRGGGESDELEAALESAEARAEAEAASARALLQKVHALQGNIRVLVRVRPPRSCLGAEVDAREVRKVAAECPVRASPDGARLWVDVPTATADPRASGSELREFRFDHVFGCLGRQAEVFGELEALVQSALDGTDATVLAYGQTGSGKTHTISGTADDHGVVPRTIHSLFHLADERAATHQIQFRVSVLEVYNETFRDLLANTPIEEDEDVEEEGEEGDGMEEDGEEDGEVGEEEDGEVESGGRRRKVSKPGKLSLRMTKDGPVVRGLMEEPVEDAASALSLVESAWAQRSVGSTDMNGRSSRSHCVTLIRVASTSFRDETNAEATLALVDLAGSERLSRSHAVGDRLREARHINRSLAALGDVVAAMQQRQRHIPFRNSKLTTLLSRSLGQGARVALVAQVSPDTDDLGETLCTLKFAERAASVQLGRARRRVDTGALARAKAEIRRLRTLLHVAAKTPAAHPTPHHLSLRDTPARSSSSTPSQLPPCTPFEGGIDWKLGTSRPSDTGTEFELEMDSHNSLGRAIAKEKEKEEKKTSAAAVPPPSKMEPPRTPLRSKGGIMKHKDHKSSTKRVRVRTPAEEAEQRREMAERRLEARRAAARSSRRAAHRRRRKEAHHGDENAEPHASSASSRSVRKGTHHHTSSRLRGPSPIRSPPPLPLSPSLVAHKPLPPSPENDE